MHPKVQPKEFKPLSLGDNKKESHVQLRSQELELPQNNVVQTSLENKSIIVDSEITPETEINQQIQNEAVTEKIDQPSIQEQSLDQPVLTPDSISSPVCIQQAPCATTNKQNLFKLRVKDEIDRLTKELDMRRRLASKSTDNGNLQLLPYSLVNTRFLEFYQRHPEFKLDPTFAAILQIMKNIKNINIYCDKRSTLLYIIFSNNTMKLRISIYLRAKAKCERDILVSPEYKKLSILQKHPDFSKYFPEQYQELERSKEELLQHQKELVLNMESMKEANTSKDNINIEMKYLYPKIGQQMTHIYQIHLNNLIKIEKEVSEQTQQLPELKQIQSSQLMSEQIIPSMPNDIFPQDLNELNRVLDQLVELDGEYQTEFLTYLNDEDKAKCKRSFDGKLKDIINDTASNLTELTKQEKIAKLKRIFSEIRYRPYCLRETRLIYAELIAKFVRE